MRCQAKPHCCCKASENAMKRRHNLPKKTSKSFSSAFRMKCNCVCCFVFFCEAKVNWRLQYKIVSLIISFSMAITYSKYELGLFMDADQNEKNTSGSRPSETSTSAASSDCTDSSSNGEPTGPSAVAALSGTLLVQNQFTFRSRIVIFMFISEIS